MSTTAKKDYSLYVRLVKKYSFKMFPIFILIVIASVFYGGTNALSLKLADIILKYISGTREYFIPYLNMKLEGRNVLDVAIILLIVVNLLRSVGSFLSIISSEYVSATIGKDLRNDIYRHYLYMTSKNYDKTDTGKILSMMTFQVNTLCGALSNTLLMAVRESITLVILTMFLFYKNFQLASVIFLILPIVAGIMILSGSNFRKIFTNVQNMVGNLNSLTSEIVKSQKIVKVYCSQEIELEKFKVGSGKLFQNSMKAAFIKGISMPSIQFLVSIVIGVFTWFIVRENVFTDANELLIFAGTIVLMANPVRVLSEIQNPLNAGVIAAREIYSFLDTKTELDVNASICLRKIKGDIEFKNVSFKYNDNEGDTLKNISFSINSNETVAIVGSSGSGKTTLINILMRLYDIRDGAIYVDGININDLDLQNWRRFISLVSQQNLLFNDTITNNICYGNPVNPVLLEQAIQDSYANFVYGLTNGLNTTVGESANLLSGGQAQRIALARAFYKNSPILILDEATSSLDADSEAKIQKAIDKLKFNKTTFIIAHKLSTVRMADKILVMKNGEIVESGTHSSLIEKENGVYRSLYNTQFSSSETMSLDEKNKQKIKTIPALDDNISTSWYKKIIKNIKKMKNPLIRDV